MKERKLSRIVWICAGVAVVAAVVVVLLSRPKGGKTEWYTVGGVKFAMVHVQGGTFTMGCTAEQGEDCFSIENPSHQVTLDDYCIGQTEVTQALWEEVMETNPSGFVGDNLPVETVNYNDVKEFISRLNIRTGLNFRLPTEAEWEYAARGGRKSCGYKYGGGNDIDSVGWYNSNSGGMSHEVKEKPANELGLYGMCGNVSEWCDDWYGAYADSAQSNPHGALHGTFRLHRGGSWYNSTKYCRVSYRNVEMPGTKNNHLGFRLAL